MKIAVTKSVQDFNTTAELSLGHGGKGQVIIQTWWNMLYSFCDMKVLTTISTPLYMMAACCGYEEITNFDFVKMSS